MIRFFTLHPTVANLLMIGIGALGLAFAPSLLRETFPRIEPRRVQVTIVHPGASPSEIERAICRPSEEALQSVDNIHKVTCLAATGAAVLTAEMRSGEDLTTFTDDVERAVKAITSFPTDVEDPVIVQLGRTDRVASIAITGVARATDLRSYAEAMAARMRSFGGLPKVEVQGFSDRQIRIEISAAAARALGLSVRDVADAVKSQNIDLPAGEIEGEDRRIVLRFADQRVALDAYRDLVIASSTAGAEIRLGDVASITENFSNEDAKIIFDGKLGALLSVTKTPSDDTLAVRKRMDAFLKTERARAPPGVTFRVVVDVSSIVEDRLNMIIKNGAQGLLLVFLAIWAVFGLRQGLWIAAGLPISFLGAIALMVMVGLTVNMLTMVGFLIVVGILMDDAIVIAENIETKREQGLSPVDAAIEGAREVAPGVLSSFLTTAAIFGALAFLEGDIGEVLRVVPITMLLVLAVSLVEAFLILPNHLSHTPKSDQTTGVRGVIGRGLGWMRDRIVGPVAEAAIRWRYLTLGLGLCAFLSSVGLLVGGVVKFSPFPDVDGDLITARITMPPGATITDTEKAVAEVIAAAKRVDGRLNPKGAAKMIVGVTVQYGVNSDAGGSGPHIATVTIDLRPGGKRPVANAVILAEWRSEISADLDAARIAIAKFSVGPGGKAIELTLLGEDLEQLDRAATVLKAHLAGYRGVYNLHDDLERGPPEVQLKLLKGASALGLTSTEIARQVSAAFKGVTADEIQIGRELVEISVRLAPKDRDGLADLASFMIKTPSGQFTPLSAVAEVKLTRGWAEITRENERRRVSVTGDVDVRVANSREIVRSTIVFAQKMLAADFPGVALDVGGENAEAAKTQASMIRGFLLGLIAVYLVLSFQLRSYVEPLSVMIVIPFAAVGAILGHLLLGYDFTMPSMLGVASLAGIVVNDSILLVAQIKERHDPRDLNALAVAPKATKARFRAILLTSLTTVIGLLPLLFETSLQAQILIPLVISIAFGLMATTVLILFVVPAFFAVLDEFGLTSLARERKAAQAKATDEGSAAAQPAE
ncbi:MAG: efflux RND transporter permease subunit [Neomegalonema sp.]|nr:efflux RND transporter permease subunit [Neomegalonema sp.]